MPIATVNGHGAVVLASRRMYRAALRGTWCCVVRGRQSSPKLAASLQQGGTCVLAIGRGLVGHTARSVAECGPWASGGLRSPLWAAPRSIWGVLASQPGHQRVSGFSCGTWATVNRPGRGKRIELIVPRQEHRWVSPSAPTRGNPCPASAAPVGVTPSGWGVAIDWVAGRSPKPHSTRLPEARWLNVQSGHREPPTTKGERCRRDR